MALRQQTLRLEALLNIIFQSFKQGIAFLVYFQNYGSVCAFILYLNGEATWPVRRSEPKNMGERSKIDIVREVFKEYSESEWS